jgi:hypothetical protein
MKLYKERSESVHSMSTAELERLMWEITYESGIL